MKRSPVTHSLEVVRGCNVNSTDHLIKMQMTLQRPLFISLLAFELAGYLKVILYNVFSRMYLVWLFYIVVHKSGI